MGKSLKSIKRDLELIYCDEFKKDLRELLNDNTIWQEGWYKENGYAFKFNEKNLKRIEDFCDKWDIAKNDKFKDRDVFQSFVSNCEVRFKSSKGYGKLNRGSVFVDEIVARVNQCLGLTFPQVKDWLVKDIMNAANFYQLTIPAQVKGFENLRRVDVALNGKNKEHDVGAVVKDLVVFGLDKDGNPKECYISAKFGNEVSFINKGLGTYITRKDFKNDQVAFETGEKLLEILGITQEPEIYQHFFDVFNRYNEFKEKERKKTYIIKLKNANKRKLGNIVRECIGKGYLLVHKLGEQIKVENAADSLPDYSKVNRADVKFTYGNKRVDILLHCENDKRLRMTFRNKSANKVYPTHFLLDWRRDGYEFGCG